MRKPMPIVRVTDRRGVEHEINAPAGTVLMEELKPLDDGVFAICGGACACATCHVYVQAAWLAKLSTPPPQELDMLGELPSRRENSRLSCQIVLGEELSGLEITIAPEGE
jgi:2Fe-2S ferredoxin